MIHNTSYKCKTLRFLDMKDISDPQKKFFVESYIDEIINFKALFKINIAIFTIINWANFLLSAALSLVLTVANSKYIDQNYADKLNWVAIITAALITIGNRMKASGNYEREYLMNMQNAYLMETEIRSYIGKIASEYQSISDYAGFLLCMSRLEHIKKNSVLKHGDRDRDHEWEDSDQILDIVPENNVPLTNEINPITIDIPLATPREQLTTPEPFPGQEELQIENQSA